MYKLIVTESYNGYDISWDYSGEEKEIMKLLGGHTRSQFQLDDTSSDPNVIQLKKLLKNCPGARMTEMLGRATPIFKTVAEAQYCIDNILEPYFLGLSMAGIAI